MLSLILGLAIAAQPAPPPAPSEEAIALGRRLAASGTISGLLELITQRETEQMAARHSDLTAAEREILLQTGREVAAAGLGRINDAIGRGYAAQLTVEDLRALVAQAESPAARRQRAVMPAAMMSAMTLIGEVDFGRELRTAMCQRTQRLCEGR